MSDAVRNFAKKYAADINADLTLQLKETEEKIVSRAFVFLLILIALITILDITRFF